MSASATCSPQLVGDCYLYRYYKSISDGICTRRERVPRIIRYGSLRRERVAGVAVQNAVCLEYQGLSETVHVSPCAYTVDTSPSVSKSKSKSKMRDH